MGRGYSASYGLQKKAAAGDYLHGGGIPSAEGRLGADKYGKVIDSLAERHNVSNQRARLWVDAVNKWADGSSSHKQSQRSGKPDEVIEALSDFIENGPSYQGEIVRVMTVPDSSVYRKGGKMTSDGSITSWTTPDNLQNVLNGFGDSSKGDVVVLHMSVTHGAADTRGVSYLSGIDHEILLAGGLDGKAKITGSKTESRYDFFGDKVKVKHVNLKQ